MLTFNSDFLAKTDSERDGTHKAVINQATVIGRVERSHITIDFGNETLTNIANPVSGKEITLPDDWETATAITVNSITLVPSLTPEKPKPGEFVFNPYTKTVTPYFSDSVKAVVLNIDPPIGWQSGTSISLNDQVLIPSLTPDKPKQGEFIFNESTGKILAYFKQQARSLQILGKLQSINFYPSKISPGFPQLFYNLPLTGQMHFSSSLEGFPTASFEFETNVSKTQLESIFVPGAELEFLGAALAISAVSFEEYSIAVYPQTRTKISVSLKSKHENYINHPVFLMRQGRNIIPSDPKIDPDCLSKIDPSYDLNRQVSIQTIFERANLKLTVIKLKPIIIAQDAKLSDTVVPSQVLTEERLRLANSFVRYCKPTIEVIPITGITTHIYNESELGDSSPKSSYNSVSKANRRSLTVPSLKQLDFDLVNFSAIQSRVGNASIVSGIETAFAFEYPNVLLEGEFLDRLNGKKYEQTQSNSRPEWVKKELSREEKIEGDREADLVPNGVRVIKAMSMCFDLGGMTRTRTTKYTEGSDVYKTVDETWGFCFRAIQIANIEPFTRAIIGLAGNPNDYWVKVKEVITEYYYDYKTGYLISTHVSGFSKARFKQESTSEPETFTSLKTDPDYDLYFFFNLPIYGVTYYKLALLPEFSADDAFEQVKVCNFQKGTSSMGFVANPNYKAPYYVEKVLTELVSFAKKGHPDNKGVTIAPGVVLKPDILIGEESYFETITTVDLALYENTTFLISSTDITEIKGKLLKPQTYTTYEKKYKAQGMQIGKAIEEVSTSTQEGDPPLGQRKHNLYEKEDPQKSLPKTDNNVKIKYTYLLQSPGYKAEDPIGGSVSFPLALKFDEAFTAAKCKFYMENIKSGYEETLDIPFNPNILEGDRFIYYWNGEMRERIVKERSSTLVFNGVINGALDITGITSLKLGKKPRVNLSFDKLFQESKEHKLKNPVQKDGFDKIIGFDWVSVQSRRNYNS